MQQAVGVGKAARGCDVCEAELLVACEARLTAVARVCRVEAIVFSAKGWGGGSAATLLAFAAGRPPEPLGMRDVMELGRNVEITAQNKRLGASMRNKLLHLVVPGAPPVEAALSAAVGHVNAEELMGGRVGGLGVEKAKRKDGGRKPQSSRIRRK
jgi:hypothetical protein